MKCLFVCIRNLLLRLLDYFQPCWLGSRKKCFPACDKEEFFLIDDDDEVLENEKPVNASDEKMGGRGFHWKRWEGVDFTRAFETNIK